MDQLSVLLQRHYGFDEFNKLYMLYTVCRPSF